MMLVPHSENSWMATTLHWKNNSMIITIVLSLILIILLGLLLAAYVIIRKLLAKIEIYETWILDVKTDVISTLEKMREVDRSSVEMPSSFVTDPSYKGAFESDDQVGGVFKDLLELIDKLNQRTQ